MWSLIKKNKRVKGMQKKWQSLSSQNKVILIMSFCFFLSLMGLKKDTRSEIAVAVSPHIDTFIPKGFVLVPIEVENYQSLDSVLGQFGVVDLYPVKMKGQITSEPVVRQIKIIRSHKKPGHFAVLAPNHKVREVMKYGTHFYVIVKNPQEDGIEFVEQQKRMPIKVIVEDQE